MGEFVSNTETDINQFWYKKIFQPIKNDSKYTPALIEINKATGMFLDSAGPYSAKYVELLIKMEKPSYPDYSSAGVNNSLIMHAISFQKRSDRNPFELYTFAYFENEYLRKRIDHEKEKGAARGISEKDNAELDILGKSCVFLNKVIRELANKFPKEYLETTSNDKLVEQIIKTSAS